VYRVQCTEYSVQSTVYRVQCTEFMASHDRFLASRDGFWHPVTVYGIPRQVFGIPQDGDKNYYIPATCSVCFLIFLDFNNLFIFLFFKSLIDVPIYFPVQCTEYSLPSTVYRVKCTE